MDSPIKVFKRVEKKYLLTEEQKDAFYRVIKEMIVPDRYYQYTISNIYYDTENFDLIRRSLDKPVYKEKLRLRSYGIPGPYDNVFIEIKKKYDGTVYKRRVVMNLQEAEDYLDCGIQPEQQSQILKEIDYFLNLYNPEARLYLAYDRAAFSGKSEPDLRITFDTNIRSRTYDLSLSAGDYGDSLLEEGMYLMEIKANLSMPIWLVQTLSQQKIYPASFSKYGNIYRRKILCSQVY